MNMAEIKDWLLVENVDGVDTVTNVTRWDGDADTWTPPEGAEMLPAEDHPGVWIYWTRVDGEWFPPEPPTEE